MGSVTDAGRGGGVGDTDQSVSRGWRVLLVTVNILLCGPLAVLVQVAMFGGFTLALGPFELKAHTYTNPLVALAGLLVLRAWLRGSLLETANRWQCFARQVLDGSRPVSRPSVRWGGHQPRARLLLAAAFGAAALGIILVAHLMQGLSAHYYDNPAWMGAPAKTLRDRWLDLRAADASWFPTRYSVEWTGGIEIHSEGHYRFSLRSDDGSSLWIDDALVVDNGGEHGVETQTGSLELDGGFHALRIRYMQQGGSATFAAAWCRADENGNASSVERPLRTAMLLPRQPGWASLLVLRTGGGLINLGNVLAVPFVSLICLAGILWGLASRRACRVWLESVRQASVDRLVYAASILLELALWAVLLSLIRLAWSGPFRLFLGFADLQVPGYLTPAVTLSAVLTVRWWLQGSAWAETGRFRADTSMRDWMQGAGPVARKAIAVVRRPSSVIVLVVVGYVVGAVGLAASWQQGLTARYYRESAWVGQLTATTHDRDLTLRRAIYDYLDDAVHYSIDWSGVVHIPAKAEYEFALTSRGRSGLWLDGDLVVDGLNPHAQDTRAKRVRLGPGFHPITVRYAPTEVRRSAFKAEFRQLPMGRAPEEPRRPLSSAVLFPAPPSAAAFAVFQLNRQLLAAVGLVLLSVLAVVGGAGARWLLSAVEAKVGEHHVYLALLLSLAAAYYLAPFTDHVDRDWGYTAFAPLGRDRTALLFLLLALIVFAYGRHRPRIDEAVRKIQARMSGRPALVLAVAAGSVVLFFAMRNGFVNSDGVVNRWLVPEAAAQGRGAGVNFDEMWESYLHGQIWYYTNTAFGWSVRLSYHVTSSLAGGLFLLMLWHYARVLRPGDALVFCLLVVSGGYMQLLFGDVENYSIAAVALLAYYYTSVKFLRGRSQLWCPAATLSIAMTCHMLAGFLLPSLVYLHVVELRKRAYVRVVVGAAAFAAVFLVTMAVLGKPLDALYRGSQGAHAVRVLVAAVGNAAIQPGAVGGEGRWAWLAFDAYHWNQYNLLALMFPANLLLVPLVLFRRVKMDAINLHLIAAALGLAFFQFNYRALLPLDHDWNLYANAAIPLAILVWRNFLAAEGLTYKAELILAWGLLSFAHSYAWIVANHYFSP